MHQPHTKGWNLKQDYLTDAHHSYNIASAHELRGNYIEPGIYLEGGGAQGFPTPEVDFPIPRISKVYIEDSRLPLDPEEPVID